jgi:SAM-dependent methyltransferase
MVGSATSIPAADASIDVAISFETLEHIREQDEFIAELHRVLKPDGVLLISCPNKAEYTDKRGTQNEFHVKELYRADDATADKPVRDQLKTWEEMGFRNLPVCIAKTQYSFSTNPDAKGAPSGFNIPVREVRLSAGAEFVVAICGEIMTMPGLPKVPSADSIDVGADGRIVGLF